MQAAAQLLTAAWTGSKHSCSASGSSMDKQLIELVQMLAAPQPGSTSRCLAANSTQPGSPGPTCTLSLSPRGPGPRVCQPVTERAQACSTKEITVVVA